MPSPSRSLTAGDAISIVRDLAVQPTSSPPRIGLELEWLTFPVDDPSRRVDLTALAPVLDTSHGALPCGSRVTVEPGGQIELSTPPFEAVGDTVDAARTDAAALRSTLAHEGIDIVGAGVDRRRAPTRIVDTARYRAMEAYFDRFGPEGRTMMCNSASMQINVDYDGDVRDAWHAAHVVAFRLGQMFNEPRPNRSDLWANIDATRSASVGAGHPADAWATYALDARVMFIRTAADTCVPLFDGLTLCRWLEFGHELGWPTEDDLTEHLTTLFPPVRPRGFLELRTIDALEDTVWPGVVETAASLLFDGPERRRLLEHTCP